ncbi:general secretion pathway protein GspB [Glaciecola sp. MF2-115]|uniref:general secretion pathway protein GspB n=1 Tax=Glaciecola sp. MF2-115 TaxID=3384827 RepID=UPI0039A3DB2D
MLKTLKVNELAPGMLVSKVVSQHGPVKIRKVGMIRGPEMIKGLTEMGVTEVEVDLSQSLGLQDDDDEQLEPAYQAPEEATKLTPTQQLLQNERQTAKANNDGGQHYNRSLFMPSMDSLPSMWTLYGKNSILMFLLVVGGICVGWNIASIPTWLQLSKDKEYVQVDYQPRSIAVNRSAGSAELESESSTSDQNNNATIAKQDAELDNKPEAAVPEATQPVASEPEAEPLILGYQPESVQNLKNTLAAGSAQSKTEEIVNASNNSSTDPAVSAALLEKINKAIANLDNDSGEEQSDPLANNYDDLPRVDQLSIAIQTQIPSMTFSAHMYSSNRDGRWVRVNGRRLVEGDYIAENLQLVNIEPQKVILSFKDEVFTMNALSDW